MTYSLEERFLGLTLAKSKYCARTVFFYMNMNMLVDRFCDNASYMKGYTEDTIRRYRSNIDLFCKRANVYEIEKVNKDVVRTFFYEGRTIHQWSPTTFITYHKTLKVFFRWCVKEGTLKENAIDDIEKPKMEKKLPPKLTQQDALRLLEVIYNYPYEYTYPRYRNQAIFATFLFAGLRKRELLNLKYTDVDLQNLSIFIRQGKGNKDRVVPICSRLAEILRRYVQERCRLKKTCPEFFASMSHNAGLTMNGFKHLIDFSIEAFGTNFF